MISPIVAKAGTALLKFTKEGVMVESATIPV